MQSNIINNKEWHGQCQSCVNEWSQAHPLMDTQSQSSIHGRLSQPFWGHSCQAGLCFSPGLITSIICQCDGNPHDNHGGNGQWELPRRIFILSKYLSCVLICFLGSFCKDFSTNFRWPLNMFCIVSLHKNLTLDHNIVSVLILLKQNRKTLPIHDILLTSKIAEQINAPCNQSIIPSFSWNTEVKKTQLNLHRFLFQNTQ